MQLRINGIQGDLFGNSTLGNHEIPIEKIS